MIRNGGALDGVAHPLAADRRADDAQPDRHAAFAERPRVTGSGFETTDRYGANGLDPVGAFGWAGAYGSMYRVDPNAGITILLMIQLLPQNTDLGQRYPTLVHQAFVDEAPTVVRPAPTQP